MEGNISLQGKGHLLSRTWMGHLNMALKNDVREVKKSYPVDTGYPQTKGECRIFSRTRFNVARGWLMRCWYKSMSESSCWNAVSGHPKQESGTKGPEQGGGEEGGRS